MRHRATGEGGAGTTFSSILYILQRMIRSAEFDDIYFSPDDGLAETAHVFLRGNNLPAAWENRQNFTITETGFGTGLNFLAAWKLFEETAAPGATLDYVSFEKFPLSHAQMVTALSRWGDFFDGRLARLTESYPLRLNGMHRVHVAPRVRLTLIFDDVNDALPQLTVPCGVDAWFLDGFAPAKNPQMWSDLLFREMARLSAPGARVASFTAAGLVRRGLSAQGFQVTKTRGYGRKRDMTVAVFAGDSRGFAPVRDVRRVAVIGAGLAGTSCAYALKRRGMEVRIFDPDGVAHYASGNPIGLYNPRFSQRRSAESDFFSSGFAALAALVPPPQRCGSLHLAGDENKEKRLRGMMKNWGWHSDHVSFLDAAAASDKVGVCIERDGLWLPDSGFISPRDLCRFYADGVTVSAETYDPRDYDAVILANGIAAKEYPGLQDLPIYTVRGQISLLAAVRPVTVRANICYGGYLSAVQPDGYVAGATFQQWRSDNDVTDDDHREIIGQMARDIPALAGAFRVTGGRASLRCAAKDRFPVVGMVPESAGLYVSTAHGSHGLVSTLASAEYLADLIMGSPHSLPLATAAALSPVRFTLRACKKGGHKDKLGE